MNMLDTIEIYVNGSRVQIGGRFSTPVKSFSLNHLQGFSLAVPKSQSPQIKRWLNSIVENLECEYVTYQNTLIPVPDIRKF